MTESPTPSKFTKWNRAIVGGLLSGGIACAYTYWFYELSNSDDFALAFVALPFSLPAELLYNFGVSWFDNWYYQVILFVWGAIGLVISYYVRKNKPAIFLWLLLLVIFGFMAISWAFFF